ncbi:hypothetical protein OH768_07645 [Streptomyces sp. NBC_01622]|uniref:hypothetical protein n=1 Tax=Streptomyces sp. NBC_01622 TaxID=2975903 RepID=UPI00386F823F|nr:hypothetical protein OH768_07645 [Streptomyces sp. NBC_01622]
MTSDPDLCIAARLDIGWSLLWSDRNADAFDTLLSVAAEASPRLPALAWQAAWMAATVAHQTGLPEVSARARAALDLLDSQDGPAPAPAAEYRIWIRACTDPYGERADLVPRLRRTAEGPLSDPGTFGAAAWVLDETELAVRVLREALSRLRAPGVRGAGGGVLSALEWAYVDSGRWDDALAAAREAGDIAAAYKMETVAGSADLTTAVVAAMRGEHDRVAPLLARVRGAVDTGEYRGFAARIWQTAGLSALAQGTYTTAYAQLSRLFAADGTPLAMTAWGDKWLADDAGVPVITRHDTCGRDTHAEVVCACCKEPLAWEDVTPRPGPGYPPKLLSRPAVRRRFRLDGPGEQAPAAR